MGTAFGFPDWQRVGPFDGPDFISSESLSIVGPTILGPYSVSRWARLAGRLRSATGSQAFDIRWSDDRNFNHITGERSFNLDSAVSAQNMHVQFPNLGPWVSIFITPIANGSIGVNLFGSNRQQPLEVIPATPTLLALNGVPVTTGVARIDPVQTFYSGRVHVWIQPQSAFQWVVFELMDSSGAYKAFHQVSNLAAAADVSFDLEWPVGQARVRASQVSGSTQTLWCVVTPGGAGA